jgi:hypothetical protein
MAIRIKIFSLAILVILSGCSNRWSDSKVEESKRRGDNINAALEVYKNENSAFPTKLDSLVPKYIKKIEPPLAGNGKWMYEVYDEGQQYDLGFGGDSDKEPVCWYSHSIKSWVCDTK